MLFILENVSTELSIILAKSNARRFVILCRKNATENALNEYLKLNYKIDLISACLKIINKASYSFNGQGETVVTVIDKELDKLASIITFGTGKVKGSNILRYAFNKI